jgi:glycosyltransferase involved in cell wall biosynthesis
MTQARSQQRTLSRVSAFVPAYNEADNIAEVVERLHRALDRVAREHELIVVLYEGCTDGTDKILERLAAEDERLRVVLQPKDRKGYGVALRLGFEAARYPYVFYTDADNQFDPDEIDRFVGLVRGYDIITGYREQRQDPAARKFTAWVYNKLMDLALGTNVRDVDCAFKLYKKAVFSDFSPISETGLIDAEIIARARQAGRRVGEVAVTHHPRTAGEGHFEADTRLGLPDPRVVLDILKELLTVRRQLKEDSKVHADQTHVL